LDGKKGTNMDAMVSDYDLKQKASNFNFKRLS
jgi:hypothetical protein